MQRAAGKVPIAETEQIHRAGTARRIARTVISERPDSQQVAHRVQRHRTAETVKGVQRADIAILVAAIALAERGLQLAAGETRIAEAEQIHRAGIGRHRARCTVIAIRPNGEAIAGRVQRHRTAETIALEHETGRQRADIDILAAGIALAERGLQLATGKVLIREREQIHRAGIARPTARRAVIKRRPHGQPVTRRVQRHRDAEAIIRPQRAAVDRVLADHAAQRAAGKTGIGEREQIHRPGVVYAVVRRAVIAGRADGEAITGAVQRQGRAEAIAHLQRGHIAIVAARIARAERAGPRAARERVIREREQIRRAGIAHRIARTVIERRADGEAVAGRVQRYRLAELIARL